MQHEFQVSLGDDTVYSVVVFEYPDGKAPKPDTDYYVKLVNAYAKGSETRVRRKGAATVAARDGYEAAAEDGKNKLNHLVAIVADGNHIYMLASAGPKGHAQSKDAKRFLDSFRLLSDPPAQPADTPQD
jgi:predicted Zn-dependent protease